MPETLTPIERRIYNFLIDHLKKETYQPSVREIGSRFGIRSTKTVTEHLQSLQRKGYLDRTPSRSRALKILGLNLSPRTYSIPIYGQVPGRLMTEPDGAYELDQGFACSADCFLVRVRGDHLNEAGVRDGDLLLVQPGEAAEVGGPVVVQRAGRIELGEASTGPSGNGAAGDQHAGGRLLGVARGLIRSFH